MSDSEQDITQPLLAVLGPTNTGKTHLAIERMLGYETGMIGLPLRLLAREVYDRVAKNIGAGQVALVTGEEKIIPKQARYFICTIEAMPLSRSVDFMAIDEVQLCADPERGYIFTDRLLHARGRQQTMLLGAATMQNLIKTLLPKAHIITRPRFSKLSYAGSKKISRLPRRSAIAAFSADNVYAIAQLIREQKGGAAVVMGALSPRTRNAQVAMYQSGEVDYLVATDAIGMGLNMDVEHVAFAQTRKFDGRTHRALMPDELAQIAGRAGRHIQDGTFGVTGDVAEFDESVIEQIENHDFDALKTIMWRNPNLDFTNLASLKLSLEAPSPRKGLVRAPIADDLQALTLMSHDPALVDRVSSESRLRLLWEVAQTPDYRKTMASEHAALLGEIFMFLTGPEEGLPTDWLDERIKRCDNVKGDLDTLAARLAHIRTWTYISQKNNWVRDPGHWQNRARHVEDKLSDALHEGLMKQFVDKKSSALMRRLQGREDADAHVDLLGDVYVEGEYAGHIAGLRFQRDPRLAQTPARAIRAALDKTTGAYLRTQAETIAKSPDECFSLSATGDIIWTPTTLPNAQEDTENQTAPMPKGRLAVVGKIRIEQDWLKPVALLLADEALNGAPRQQAEARITQWARAHVQQVLAPLQNLKQATDLSGLARGLAFQLVEHGGKIARAEIQDILSQLDQPARGSLRKYGVRFGAYHVFMPHLLKPVPARRLALFWSLSQARDAVQDLSAAPVESLTSDKRQNALPDGFYDALGFMPLGQRIVRLDMLERLADVIRTTQEQTGRQKAFQTNPDMMSLLGCSDEELAEVLIKLGYQKLKSPPPAPAQPALPAATDTTANEETTKEPTPEIWWRWGGAKRRKPNTKSSKKPHKSNHVKNQTKPMKKTENARAAQQKAKQKNKPIDPDSPFASLAALKTNPTAEKNG
ncbi:MAG: helicase-related protein [Parvibaculales bacterium]